MFLPCDLGWTENIRMQYDSGERNLYFCRQVKLFPFPSLKRGPPQLRKYCCLKCHTMWSGQNMMMW